MNTAGSHIGAVQHSLFGRVDYVNVYLNILNVLLVMLNLEKHPTLEQECVLKHYLHHHSVEKKKTKCLSKEERLT